MAGGPVFPVNFHRVGRTAGRAVAVSNGCHPLAGYGPSQPAKYVKLLAEKHRLKTPISTGVYQILNRETGPLNFLDNWLDSR
jgi:glycerol-3-phosphate dehydrogenase